jgi:hypothetical protein
VFKQGEADAKPFFAWRGNAAAGMGRFTESAAENVTELILGHCESNGTSSTYAVNTLRYTYDPGKKSWDFISVFSQSKGSAELMPVSYSISDLTSVVFQDISTFTEKHRGDLYINGVLYYSKNSTDTGWEHADYSAVCGQFGSDAPGWQAGASAGKISLDGAYGYVTMAFNYIWSFRCHTLGSIRNLRRFRRAQYR